MNNHKLIKIISGGQTGADKAALIAAKRAGLKTGGWCIKNYKNENGEDLELQNYGIKCLNTDSYPKRSMINVDKSDGTIVFRLKYSVGSDKTIGYAQLKLWKNGLIKSMNINETNYKPVLIIEDIKDKSKLKEDILSFINNNKISILNIAGHRESSAPIKNFQNKIENILYEIFSSL